MDWDGKTCSECSKWAWKETMSWIRICSVHLHVSFRIGYVDAKQRRLDTFALTVGAAAGLARFLSFFKGISACSAFSRDNAQPLALGAKCFGNMLNMLGDVFFRNPEHDRQLPATQGTTGCIQAVDNGLAKGFPFSGHRCAGTPILAWSWLFLCLQVHFPVLEFAPDRHPGGFFLFPGLL